MLKPNFKGEVTKYHSFSQEALQAFVKILKCQTLKKKYCFLRRGQSTKSYAYVGRGSSLISPPMRMGMWLLRNSF
jgi:hypothetical protein